VNIWQVQRQIKKLLSERTWEGTGARVFGAVRISNGPAEAAASSLIYPSAFIGTGDGAAEDQIPGHLTRSVEIRIMARASGDTLGENAMIGANRTDTAHSEGRGLLELEEEVFATIKQLQNAFGIKISFRAVGMGTPEYNESTGMMTNEVLRFEADCTDARYYHPPQELVATGGVGQVTLSWALPPSRWDRRRVRLIRKAGATPPANIADGTVVTLAGDLSTGVVDSGLAPGTYSYAIFATYDEFNVPASADSRVSEPETGSTRAAVTVT